MLSPKPCGNPVSGGRPAPFEGHSDRPNEKIDPTGIAERGFDRPRSHTEKGAFVPLPHVAAPRAYAYPHLSTAEKPFVLFLSLRQSRLVRSRR